MPLLPLFSSAVGTRPTFNHHNPILNAIFKPYYYGRNKRNTFQCWNRAVTKRESLQSHLHLELTRRAYVKHSFSLYFCLKYADYDGLPTLQSCCNVSPFPKRLKLEGIQAD